MASEFTITNHKGFHMTFENGWSISVQWGPGNYTVPRDYAEPFDAPVKSKFYSKQKAEIAIRNPQGDFNPPSRKLWGDDVLGQVSTDEVLHWMKWTASRKNKAAAK